MRTGARGHNRLLAGINRILSFALSAKSENELCAEALAVVQELTCSELGFISEVVDDPKRMGNLAINLVGYEACSIEHSSPSRAHVFPVDNLFSTVVERAQPLVLDEEGAARLTLPDGHMRIESLVAIPVIWHGDTVAVIALGNRPGGYTDDEVSSLEEFAPIVWASVERLRSERRLSCLTVELQNELASTRLLTAVAEAAASALSLQELCERVMDALTEQLDMRMGAITALDDDRTTVSAVATRGMSNELRQSIQRLPLDADHPSLIVRAALRDEIVSDLDVEEDTVRAETLGPFGFGEERTLRHLALPIRGDRGVVGTISFAFDGRPEFTKDELDLYRAVAYMLGQAFEKTRLFEAEHAATEALQRQAEERQQWLAGISHDLRTPLATIRGYAELLSTEDGLPDELRRQTDIILGQSKRIQSLISDMLLAFQIEGGHLPIDLKRTDLAEVLGNVEEIVRSDPRFMHRDVTFMLDGQAHFSRIDFSHFTRALVNVVVNALNHNPLDTSVVVGLSELDDTNQITVVDDGDGIDESTLERVWERFTRGISSSQDTDGVGLGMATTRHLVELMDGEIGVTSSVGVGTTITIRLPKDPAEASYRIGARETPA